MSDAITILNLVENTGSTELQISIFRIIFTRLLRIETRENLQASALYLPIRLVRNMNKKVSKDTNINNYRSLKKLRGENDD